MMASVIALFGEAERGKVNTGYFCQNLQELFELLGEPPEDTHGLYFAIQTLLYGQPLVYFRVSEEGASFRDYHFGLHLLRDSTSSFLHLQALFLPGVGSKELIEEGLDLCRSRSSLLIMNEADFYDYLTHGE